MSSLTLSRRTKILALCLALLCLALWQQSHQFRAKLNHLTAPVQAGDALQPHLTDAAPAPRATFTPTRMLSGGREVAGFSAHLPHPATADAPTPPAGLKPAEAEAWLQMAKRQGSAATQTLESFYPAQYGEPFIVEGEGVRVAVTPVGGVAAAATIEDGNLMYRAAYPATDSKHVVTEGRSEEFLYLQSAAAPRQFEYEISEVSAGTEIKLVDGEVRFVNTTGRGVKIEAPWVMEPNGTKRTDVVRWELEEKANSEHPRLWLKLTESELQYPLVIDPSWSTTGSLATARNNHTATLLPNGKVLVAGGTGSFGVGSSAELYDPTTGTWSITGSLNFTHVAHTATLLRNGKVLVAGGSGTGNMRTELYDPATGTWSIAGNLNTAHAIHTATLLANGKVLVAGGDNGAMISAELYDPATDTWSTTGNLITPRYNHTATLLPNGKVLVAGGFAGINYLTSAELYDPVTGTWSATGNLTIARYYHTATLLPNGKVLVVGGRNSGGYLASAELYDPTVGTWVVASNLITARYAHMATLLPNGKVLVTGGQGASDYPTSTELYDPTTNTWSTTGNLTTTRRHHTATLLPNGKVLVAGGYNGIYLASAELYDPATGNWAATGNLNTARSYHTATLLPNGKVLVAGGVIDNGDSLTSAELYDPSTGTWSATGSLATARFGHTATLLPSGKVLVAGGFGNSGSTVASTELYDPALGTWSATGNLAASRYLHTAPLLPNGKVLIAGGQNSSGRLASAELYDPATGTWSTTGSLATARSYHTATLLPSGKVLVAAGSNGGFLASAELYDPALGTWSATGSLATARYAHTATLLPNGKVLVAAGQGASSVLTSAELYDPSTGNWSTTGSLAASRNFHTATLLPNGQVLVAGGFNGSIWLTSTELYDPAFGTWAATASLATARYRHTATLLPNGKVLAAAGVNNNIAQTSAELYDVGLGFLAAWQPVLTSATSPLFPNAQLTAMGTQFQGISEASGGSFQNSSTNYPLVQLLSLVNEQSVFLPLDMTAGWSATSFTSSAVTQMTVAAAGFPPGYALVTVFANGIPSTSRLILLTAPTVNPVTPVDICSGAMTNIALTSTPAGASFSWTIGTVTGIVSGQAAGAGSTIAQTLTGSGSVTYVVTPTLNGWMGTPVNIVQTVKSTPTVNAVTPMDICSGAMTNIALTSTPADATFSWTIGTVTGLVSGQAAGAGSTIAQTLTGSGSVTYVVTPTLNGCPGTPVHIVQTVQPTPVVNPVMPADICSGAMTNIALSSTPAGATFSWTASLQSGTVTGFSNSTGSTIAQMLTGNGVVKYTVTASLNGCPSAPVDILQTVNDLPVPIIDGVSEACAGATGLSFNGNGGASSYLWEISSGNGSIVGSTTSQFVSVTAGASNSFTLKLTLTNGFGCPASTTKVVTIKPTPVVTPASPAALCSGSATNIILGSDQPGATFSWTASLQSGSVTGFSSDTGGTIAQMLTGNGVVKYTVTATLNGCPSAPVDILQTVKPTPVVNPVTPSDICSGAMTNIALTGTPNATFSWTIGTVTGMVGGQAAGAGSTIAQTLTSAAGGSVTYVVTPTLNGCPGTPVHIVQTVNAPPTVTTNPQPQNVNPGDMATFTAAASGMPAPTVQWQVSSDGGMNFTNVPGATSTTLSFTTMASQNGYQYRAVFSNTCGTVNTTAAQLTLCTLPTMTTQPTEQIVGQGATVNFTAAASGMPVPTVQWQVDIGSGFTNIPGATSATLNLPSVTLAMNGYRYQAVFTNGCGTATSQSALLTVNPFNVEIGDPLLCLNANGLVGVTATLTNNNAAAVNAVFMATLPTTLNGLPGTGVASINQAGLNITASVVTWAGVIPANTTVIITYKTQIVTGTPSNMPLCVKSEVTFNGGPEAKVEECKMLGCPAGPVNVRVSDQKAGSLLVFPYYVSKAAEKKDTRLTISNIGEKAATVHLFFIDGASCQQADQFLCLTPNASFSFKASEYDPDATGWLLAVAVDGQGRPIQYNGLIGNAFVNDGEYVDNYGAESFWANSPLVATINNDTATLFFDNQSYDAVPNQFAIEVQSPIDAAGQRVVTVGLQGDLTTSKLTGAAQVGTAQVINGNEKPFGSFNGWLSGACQAIGAISTTSPRVPNSMAGMIPSGQVGTIKLNIGAGVGLLMTPRTATWRGIRTLHKTGLTTTTLTIPVLVPVC